LCLKKEERRRGIEERRRENGVGRRNRKY